MKKQKILLTIILVFSSIYCSIYGQMEVKVKSTFNKPGSEIVFKKITIDSANSNITGIYADDMNGDGLKDIVVCENSNNKISLWVNNGSGLLKWTKSIVDDNYSHPLYVNIKDINNDGRKDIIASSSMGNSVAWWKNEGGIWTKQIIDSDLKGAHAVDAADFNGDGNMDVIAVSAGSNKVVWWQSDGSSPIHWTKRVVDSLFNVTQTCKAVDVDKDGKIDIVAASSGNNEIAWWKNKGGNPVVWEKFIIADNAVDGVTFPHWIETADMDNDGDLDVVGSMYSTGEIAWWENENGKNAYWKKNNIVADFKGVLTVKTADLNNDTFVDVVGTSTYLRDIVLWNNSGNKNAPWKEFKIDGEYKGAWPLFICDLDNDGDMDIICGADVPSGNSPLSWWRNDLINKL